MIRSLGVAVVVVAVTACSSVPFDYPKQESFQRASSQESPLAQLRQRWLVDSEKATAIYPLPGGADAFDARLDLAARAAATIDAQYFLIKPDRAGAAFTGALLRAADRGVRVRLLIDDVLTTVDDYQLSLLNAHPRVEVRLFNPVSRQGIGALNFLADFGRANRRMHNKSFTVDRQVSIVGGRNIADEYFEMNPEVDFLDYDVIAFGGLIEEIGDSFDQFWNSDLSVPMEAFNEQISADDLNDFRREADEWRRAHPQADKDHAVDQGVVAQLLNGEIRPWFAEARVISDHPAKLLNPISPDFQRVANTLGDLIDAAEEEVIVYSPYFIPFDGIDQYLIDTQARGVNVYIFTNSLAATNHVAAHPHYARYRKRLLEAGVTLFEISANGNVREGGKTTLHAKAILVDSRWLFAGSLNVDPRSIDINTEMGIILDAPELSAHVAAAVARDVEYAYRVELAPDGSVQWARGEGEDRVVLKKEPETSWWRRFQSGFYGVLPLEKQL